MGLVWIFLVLFILGSFYFFNGKLVTNNNSVAGDVKKVNKKKKKKSKGKVDETEIPLVETTETTQKKGKNLKKKSQLEPVKLKVEPVVEIPSKTPTTNEPKKSKKSTPVKPETSPKETPKLNTSKVEKPKQQPATSLKKTKKTSNEQKKGTPLVQPTINEKKEPEEPWYREEAEKPPARVMKIKGPDPESASEEEPEEGWVKIKRTVHSPKLTPAPTNIELLNEKTVTGQSILSKTQRKNARRALKRKEEREAFQGQQEIRLRQHRREQMNARINSKDYAPQPQASSWNVPGAADSDEDSEKRSEQGGLIWDV